MKNDNDDRWIITSSGIVIIGAIAVLVVTTCLWSGGVTLATIAKPPGIGDVVPCTDYVTITQKISRLESDGEHYFIVTNSNQPYEINGWGQRMLNNIYWGEVPLNRTVKLYRGTTGYYEDGYAYAVAANVTKMPGSWGENNYCVVVP